MEESKTLKGRHAAAPTHQVCQFLMVITYLLVIGISYIVKCFKKQKANQPEENLEMMENCLQERKTKRRSALCSEQDRSSVKP